jgi:tetratricopeptide (TPR) repeat protein
MIFVLASIAVILMALPVFAGGNEELQAGINAFQQGRFDEAQTDFEGLLNDSHWSFAALYNLGNVAARQKHFGEALAYYKLALNKKPHDADTKFNIAFAMNNLSPRRSQNPGNFELFRTEVLSRFAFGEFLAATLILALIFLSSLLEFFRRKKALALDDPTARPAPTATLVVSGVVFAVALTFAILKLADSYTGRGIIITNKADLRSGPGESNASMMEVPEGSEVVIQDSSNGWYQVSLTGGGLTGWVPSSSLILTSGRGPW